MNIESDADDTMEVEIPDTEVAAGGEPEVEIVEEPVEKKPKKTAKTEKPKEEAAETEDEVEAKLQKLKEQYESRLSAAEKRANEAAQTAHKHQTEAQDANLHLITNAMRTLEQSNDILKANYRVAAQNGDFDAMADIQIEMSNNAAKLAKLEDGKIALENAPKPEAPQPYADNPVEALAAQLSPRSAAWVRSHPEFATDPRKYQAMLAAHNLAVSNGIDPDTDEYFEDIETSLRIRRNDVVRSDDDDAMSAAAKPTQRRASPAAAPVSRTATTSGGNPNRVTLSALERETARDLGLTDQEYARNKLALIREGRMN
ncbi:MAG: hypothetical protein KGL39_55095 [Patescibacteria group bacterium]|nr:hypothetical protein [Patescibacteria group bacterium]